MCTKTSKVAYLTIQTLNFLFMVFDFTEPESLIAFKTVFIRFSASNKDMLTTMAQHFSQSIKVGLAKDSFSLKNYNQLGLHKN